MIAGVKAKKSGAMTTEKQNSAPPPVLQKQLGHVKRLSVKLTFPQQQALARLGIEHNLTRPTQAFGWLLDRASREHVYIPLGEKMSKKLNDMADALGLEVADLVYNWILRSVLSEDGSLITQALATGEPTQTPLIAKTNWARAGGKEPG